MRRFDSNNAPRIGAVCLATGLALALVGCGGTGSASVTGDVSGYSFDFQTVFGWVDATERDNQDGRVAYKERDDKRLKLVFSGAKFNPEQDPRFLTAEQKSNIEIENAQGGYLSLTLTHYEKVSAGQEFSDPESAGSDSKLASGYAFAEHELAPDTEYPSEVPDLGRDENLSVRIDEAGKQPNDTVAGQITLSIGKNDSDPTNARTGQVTIDFSVSLLMERIAECSTNSDSDACDVEMP